MKPTYEELERSLEATREALLHSREDTDHLMNEAEILRYAILAMRDQIDKLSMNLSESESRLADAHEKIKRLEAQVDPQPTPES